jgi:hypothetical protein
MKVQEEHCDVLIVGGGVGGCAAALAVARAGYRVILTEETDWIGGQLTSQATPPDEHGWIEQFGCTASYRRFREGVRDYYRRYYPLCDAAKSALFLNPGNGWVSPLCHEPRVALAVLGGMLAPFVSSGSLTILRDHRPVTAEARSRNRVGAVTLRDLRDGAVRTITASYFLDATELGDLIALSGTESVTGAESQAQTGEPHAPANPQPQNIQAFSVCFAIDHIAGEDHIIERPAEYERWCSYIPQLEPAWPGPLLSWTAVNPRTLAPVIYRFDPNREASVAFSGMWNYRRILDRQNFADGFLASDICLVNWPMIDCMEGDLINSSEVERSRYINQARQLSLSALYWLQTEAPRPDGGVGWPGLRLRPDVVGTEDGLAKYPYIRESRRIQAEFTVREQHVAAAARPAGSTHAETFDDSVGIGYYRIDLHPSTGGDNYIDVASLPFQVPLGALIPVRTENLLPAAKNIGTTHITNGCYRLHPVEWNIGEAAGTLAAYCLDHKLLPRAVYRDAGNRSDFQRYLVQSGIELAWPKALNLEEGDPHRHAM